MNAQYPPAFDYLLEIEGGYSARDNKNGAVNMGITQKTWDSIRRKFKGHWLTMPADVKDLTRGNAFDIYRDHFWQPSGAWRIHDQGLATAYLAAYINVAWTDEVKGGPKTNEATKALQRTVGVKVDGAFGPKSADAVNSRNPKRLLQEMHAGILDFYRMLARMNPTEYGDDIGGWEKRLKRVERDMNVGGS